MKIRPATQDDKEKKSRKENKLSLALFNPNILYCVGRGRSFDNYRQSKKISLSFYFYDIEIGIV